MSSSSGGSSVCLLRRLTSSSAKFRQAYLSELPSLIDEINAGHLSITPRPVALRDVESAWVTCDVPGERTVLIP
jgi:hypothetical protein